MGLTYYLCLFFFSFHQQYEWLIGSQYKPIELAKSDWVAIRKSPPWAIDSWGLGKSLLLHLLMCCLINMLA
jgi:hypothetical protein